jgi:hypothetical protein
VLIGADAVLFGVLDILLVVLALDLLHMNDAGPGILNSALGVGGLLGGAASVHLVGRTHHAPAKANGAVIAGAGAASNGLATWPGLALVLIAVSGAGRSFLDVTAATLLQRSLPDDQLGAALGLQESLLMAGTAVGALLAPLLAQPLSSRDTAETPSSSSSPDSCKSPKAPDGSCAFSALAIGSARSHCCETSREPARSPH